MAFIKNKFSSGEYSDDYGDFSETIFLDSLEKKNVNVFLLGGVKLVGEFYGHDNTSIMLKRDNSDQIVYKNAISSISRSHSKNNNNLPYN